MNDGNTGYPWSTGDVLLAQDLNSAIANAGGGGASGGGSGVIRLMDQLVGVQRPDGVDCTAAMLACIAQAQANAAAGLASVIELPAGVIALTSLIGISGKPALQLPSNTTLRGQGMDATTITWPDTGTTAFMCIGTTATYSTIPAPVTLQNIALRDFTISGSSLTNFFHNGWSPIFMNGVADLKIERVRAFGSRSISIAAWSCLGVTVRGCEVLYGGSDGIAIWSSSQIIIDDNIIRHNGDNCISAHSQVSEPWGQRRNIVITNNNVFDSPGINVIAPRNVVIANNVLDCVHEAGILMLESSASSPVYGYGGSQVVVVSDNVITNVINQVTFTPPGVNSAYGIIIQVAAARTGALGTIPGENVPGGAGAVVDATIYFQSNSASTSIATAGSYGYVITNNIIARTLPACDGSATATGGTGTTYNSFQDFGFVDAYGGGGLWTYQGWTNPSITEAQFRFTGITLSGSQILRSAVLSGNKFRGLAAGVSVSARVAKDIMIEGNTFFDCLSLGGVVVNPGVGSGCGVYIRDNMFDIDPYMKSAARLPNGAWNIFGTATAAGVWVQSGTGVVVQRNHFRNCLQPYFAIEAPVQASGNWLEFSPAQSGVAGSVNKGIGTFALDGSAVLHIDGDPASSTYGNILDVAVAQSFAMPVSGTYLIGSTVQKSFPQVDANGWMLTGWRRLTQGNGQVAGVDWAPIYSLNHSVDFTAVPVLGASDGTVRAITVTTAPGEFQFYNNGTLAWPTVTIDAPPSGGTQATATVSDMSLQIGTTITPTTTVQAGGGFVTIMVSQGTSYAPGNVLTAVGGASTTPVSGTVLAAGTVGQITSFLIDNPGHYSAFPPDPATWTGGAGSGFQTHLALWRLNPTGVTVTNPGQYKTTVPGATLSAGSQATGLLSVQMGQSWYADNTGAHGTTAIVSQTIATVAANTVTVPAGTNYVVVQDSVHPVNTLTVGSGTLADGYDLWMSFPNGGMFSGQSVSAHGILTLKVLGGGWSILSKFG